MARVVLVRGEHRHRTDPGSRNGLRHLPDGALSRGSASRRESRRQLLHRLQGRHADHHRVRADDRRRVLLPDVCAPELLPHHGSGCRDHHAIHHRRSADAWSGNFDGGEPVRDVRSTTGRQGACVSTDRSERGALAGADPGRQFGHRHVGCDLRAELSAELRRSAVPAAQFEVESGFPSRRPTFPQEQIVLRNADGGNRPRYAQLSRFHLAGPGRSSSDPPAWCGDGPRHDQTFGSTARTRQHSLLVHYSGQRQRSTAAVQPRAEHQHRRSGKDPGRLSRGATQRDHLFSKGLR